MTAARGIVMVSTRETPPPKSKKQKRSLAPVVENRLREWRQHRGFSQTDLGNRCGLHQQTIHRLETGIMQMTVHYLDILSKVLQVTPADLLPSRMAKQNYRPSSGRIVRVIR